MVGRIALAAGAALAVAALGACASSPDSGRRMSAQSEQASNRVCIHEMPTGSRISRTTCMSKAQYAARPKQEEHSTQQFRDAVQRDAGVGSGSSGGDGAPISRRRAAGPDAARAFLPGLDAEASRGMLLDSLDPHAAENPKALVVCGGIGRAARKRECFGAGVATLRRLGNDETLLVRSARPVGEFRTQQDAPGSPWPGRRLAPKRRRPGGAGACGRQGLDLWSRTMPFPAGSDAGTGLRRAILLLRDAPPRWRACPGPAPPPPAHRCRSPMVYTPKYAMSTRSARPQGAREMMGKIVLAAGAALAVAALGACASSPNSGSQMSAKNKQKSDMVCIHEMPKGSHIPQTTCMSKAQYAARLKQEQQDAQKLNNSFQRVEGTGSGNAGSGGGGGLR